MITFLVVVMVGFVALVLCGVAVGSSVETLG
jgi:hypothetical protein